MQDVLLNAESMQRFYSIRDRLFSAIKRELEIDSHCKHYEGEFTVSIRFPNYFNNIFQPVYNVHLDMYLLGPHRHYDWTAKTFEECLDKVDRDISLWITDSQNEDWDEERDYLFEGWNSRYTRF